MRREINKVTALDHEMYARLEKGPALGKRIREFLDIPITRPMGIKTQVVNLGKPSSQRDMFRENHSGRILYYVVINPMDEEEALCFCIYPR